MRKGLLVLASLLMVWSVEAQTFTQEVLVAEEDAGFPVAVLNKASRVWPDTSANSLGIAYHNTTDIGFSIKNVITGVWTHNTVKTGVTVRDVYVKSVSNTTWLIFWSEASGASQSWHTRSDDSGATWSASVSMGTAGLARGGGVHVANATHWSVQAYTNDAYYRTENGGSSFAVTGACVTAGVGGWRESAGYRDTDGTFYFISQRGTSPDVMDRGSSANNCSSVSNHGAVYGLGGGIQQYTQSFSMDRGVIAQTQPDNVANPRIVYLSNPSSLTGAPFSHSPINSLTQQNQDPPTYTGSGPQIHVTPVGSSNVCAVAFGTSGLGGTTQSSVWTTLAADHKCDGGSESLHNFNTASFPAEYGRTNHAIFDAFQTLYYISTNGGDIISLTNTDDSIEPPPVPPPALLDPPLICDPIQRTGDCEELAASMSLSENGLFAGLGVLIVLAFMMMGASVAGVPGGLAGAGLGIVVSLAMSWLPLWSTIFLLVMAFAMVVAVGILGRR